ncbi:MAG TPA: DNA polymerase ligase N-terminal domain-containing protein [Longimicrobiales bacterium]|nr:DNA polymerase ligase N-terminal domain-containing protein [Longimicrobiales bacterium]
MKRAKGSAGELAEYRRKRDFGRTPEPSGERTPGRRARGLQYVIQKHAASHLHFDLRLELDGVMKSWAVPRGPSVDPSVKRLAMQVEDHPMAYNSFEGTIPAGEYGGGTVMLWDRGTYTADEAGAGDDAASVLRREYRAGKMSISFRGERLRGSWALVRTEAGAKPKWLFIKHRDRHARRGADIAAEHITSVDTGRTMEEIAQERDRVWRSNRGAPRAGAPRSEAASGVGLDPDAIRPMRAMPVRRLPEDERVFQAWHGGERALAFVTAGAAALFDEHGRNRSAKLRDVADALKAFAKRARTAFVLDGEIAAQGGHGSVLHVLDILLLGEEPLATRPWREREEALRTLFARRRIPHVRLAATGADAATLLRNAQRDGLAGVFARRPESIYRPGKRTDDLLRVPTPARFR